MDTDVKVKITYSPTLSDIGKVRSYSPARAAELVQEGRAVYLDAEPPTPATLGDTDRDAGDPAKRAEPAARKK